MGDLPELRQAVKDIIRHRDQAITAMTPGASELVELLLKHLERGLHRGVELWHVVQSLENIASSPSSSPNEKQRKPRTSFFKKDKPNLDSTKNSDKRVSHKFASGMVFMIKTSLTAASDKEKSRAWIMSTLNGKCFLACLELMASQALYMESNYAPSAVLRNKGTDIWDDFVQVIAPIAGPPLEVREVASGEVQTVVTFSFDIMSEGLSPTRSPSVAPAAASPPPVVPQDAVPPKKALPEPVQVVSKPLAPSSGKKKIKVVKKIVKVRKVKRVGGGASDTQSLASTMMTTMTEEQEASLYGTYSCDMDEELRGGGDNSSSSAAATVDHRDGGMEGRSTSSPGASGVAMGDHHYDPSSLSPPPSAPMHRDSSSSLSSLPVSPSVHHKSTVAAPPAVSRSSGYAEVCEEHSILRKRDKNDHVYRFPSLDHPPIPICTEQLKERTMLQKAQAQIDQHSLHPNTTAAASTVTNSSENEKKKDVVSVSAEDLEWKEPLWRVKDVDSFLKPSTAAATNPNQIPAQTEVQNEDDEGEAATVNQEEKQTDGNATIKRGKTNVDDDDGDSVLVTATTTKEVHKQVEDALDLYERLIKKRLREAALRRAELIEMEKEDE